MATRSIVTSQPDVACDVCERRLLRGEQSDVFLAAGQRRTVCELCAPRATHEGWLRESDHDAVSVPPLRARRGRSLFDRLRQVRKATDGPAEVAATDPSDGSEEGQYDFLDGLAGHAEGPPAEPQQGAEIGDPPILNRRGAAAERKRRPAAAVGPSVRSSCSTPASSRAACQRSPARWASPEVSVRPDEDVENLVSIVIAWELCWYRYEIDIDDQGAAVRTLTQGTELGEARAPGSARQRRRR